MKLKTLAPLIIGLSAALPAAAQELSYTFVQLSYLDVDFDGDDASGFGVGISGAIHKNIFLLGSFSRIESDDEFQISATESDEATLNSRSFGIGLNYPIADRTDFVLSAEKIKQKLEIGALSATGDGEAYSMGLRSMIAPQVELSGLIQSLQGEDESDTGYSFAARYYAAPNISIGAGLSSSDDVDVMALSLRLDF
jgi:hypothetical protein